MQVGVSVVGMPTSQSQLEVHEPVYMLDILQRFFVPSSQFCCYIVRMYLFIMLIKFECEILQFIG